ncbi:MAG: pyridoxal-phosphate dependent enzyme, partial [Chloroflexota bacterium]
EAHGAGMARARPRLFGFEAEGAAPIVNGAPVADPQTVATAIRIGVPASWASAVRARDESGGAIQAVSDAEIMTAYRDVARHEGVFCEPASAAAIAGLRMRARTGDAPRRVVCVLTGNGLKDPDAARSLAGELTEVDATAAAVRRVLASA